jgi:phosphatidylinositol alpha-1,6-mannosyltransferase
LQGALPGLQPEMIGSGVQVDRFAAAPDALPAKAGPTVLSVGVNKSRKGFHVLLEAMARVRREVPDAQCVIIGDDSNAAYQVVLKEIITRHELDGCVRILGRVPEETLIGWYHAADVFALASINTGGQFEGFGLVHLEAGAAGLPAIGTLGCGAEDAIDDGETGYLVPQGDPDALAAAITRLLRNPDLRARLGAANHAKAQAHTWDRVAARVRAVYEGRLRR